MPALALADALIQVRDDVEPILVGAERGVEASILPHRPYRFHLLPLEPIYRHAWWRNLRWPFLVWKVALACNRVLDVESPVCVVGTGGYVSGPVLFQAVRRGIPVALQEQNAYPGVATRLMARRAGHVYLGFPEAERYLKLGRETIVHTFGNPITPPPEPRPDPAVARRAFGIAPHQPVLLVMGGSQGSLSVNAAVRDLLDTGGLSDVALLWSTGKAMWNAFSQYHEPPARHVRAFWDPIAHAYAVADLVVARSGAMTTAELCAWGLPAIYIPLPTSTADHQMKNAAALAQLGAAELIPEQELSPQRLRAVIEGLFGRGGELDRMGRAARDRGRPEAARKSACQLLTIVS
jgi:UDP-N-acetylglucosamine--N-acetylmuramyl-(pentapeptide) pyrophosphoryl-undecaprenol N-acetylglucosamine transferase